MYHDFDDSASNSSRNSQSTEGGDTQTLASFMDNLTRDRRSSLYEDSEVSDMENEIMQKSGIALATNRSRGAGA